MPSQPLNAFSFLSISEFHPPPWSTWRAQKCKTLHTLSEKYCDLPPLFCPCKSVLSVARFLPSDPRSSASIGGKLLLFRSPDHQIRRDHRFPLALLNFFLIRVDQRYQCSQIARA